MSENIENQRDVIIIQALIGAEEFRISKMRSGLNNLNMSAENINKFKDAVDEVEVELLSLRKRFNKIKDRQKIY